MTLSTIALTAVLSVAQAPNVDATEDRLRLEQLASAVADAAEQSDGAPFRGEARLEAAALALVAIAFHESGFSAKVQDCRVTGDHGRSITPFQLLQGIAWGGHTRAELCGDVGLAAAMALETLRSHGLRAGIAGGLFAGYAGNKGRPSKASRDTCRIWERLTREAGLVASCTGGRTIRFKEAA